jgi:hypothetical protein
VCFVSAGDNAELQEIFHNPFMGQVLFARPKGLDFPDCSFLAANARTMLDAAAAGRAVLSPSTEHHSKEIAESFIRRVSTLVDPTSPTARYELPWNEDLELSVQHLMITMLLHAYGANVSAGQKYGCPLMTAARHGNPAMVDILCRPGANVEMHRRCAWGLSLHGCWLYWQVFCGVLVCPGSAGCQVHLRLASDKRSRSDWPNA